MCLKPPNWRRALRAAFEAFAGGAANGMRPEQWEAAVRAVSYTHLTRPPKA